MESYKEGILNLNISNFEIAIEKFEEAIRNKVNLQEAYRLRSEAYFFASKYQSALESYEKMIKKFPVDETGYIGKALTLTVLGRYEEVDKLYEKALGISDRNWKTYFYSGYSNSRRKKYEQALKMYEQAITKNPLNDPICYVARSEMFCMNKNFPASRKEIEYALKAITEPENHKNLYTFQIIEIEECLKIHSKLLSRLEKLEKEKVIQKQKRESYETELTKELMSSFMLNNPAIYKLYVDKLKGGSVAGSTETFETTTDLTAKENKLICECSNCEIF